MRFFLFIWINVSEEAEGVQFPVVSPGACACQLILLAEDKVSNTTSLS